LSENFQKLFNGPRQRTLPTRLEALGARALVSMLSELLGVPVYAERAGLGRTLPNDTFEAALGQGRVVTTALYEKIQTEILTQEGRVVIDQAWIETLIRKSPRTLFILLSFAHQFESVRGEPLLAIVGEEDLLGKIQAALLKKVDARDVHLQNQLTLEERQVARNELLPRLRKMIKMLSTHDYQAYLQANDFGVLSLLASDPNSKNLSASAGAFVLAPEDVHTNELVALALLIPTLLKGASLIRDIPTVSERIETLTVAFQDIFPGATHNNGYFSIHSLGNFIQNELLGRRLVELSA